MERPDDWQRDLTERVGRMLAEPPNATLQLRSGLRGAWVEWWRFLGVLTSLGVREDDPLYVGYPQYGDPNVSDPAVVAIAHQMRHPLGNIIIRPGTDQGWQVIHANLHSAGILYYRHDTWPDLIVPEGRDWVLETYQVTQKSYLYLEDPSRWSPPALISAR